METVTLNAGREKAVLRKHQWIFSGAIDNMTGNVTEGDVVRIASESGRFLGLGHVQSGAIAIRVLTDEERPIDQEFYAERIHAAIELRLNVGLFKPAYNNAFRLVHGEGDRLPGLILDYYNGTVVFQAHSMGMFADRELIVEALKKQNLLPVQAIYNKSGSALSLDEFDEEDREGLLYGELQPGSILEHGHSFEIDVQSGQKTGFYLDQRDARKTIGKYAEGKSVLNMFSYTGGFSIYALKGGAAKATSVDGNERAISLAINNAKLNGVAENHDGIVSDAFDYLKDHAFEYDFVILDPPSFAKHKKALKRALAGYRKLNELTFKNVKYQSLVATFSCSQAVSAADFEFAVFASLAKADRRGQVIHRFGQGADHPVDPTHPESSYLKGILIYVT